MRHAAPLWQIVSFAVLNGLLPAWALAQDTVFANGFEPRRFCDLAAGAATCPGFSVSLPDLPLAAGEEVQRSFYFRSPNTAALAVRRLSAVRDAQVLEVRWSLTRSGNVAQECRPAGTFEAGACCASQSTALAVPILTAQRPFDDLLFSGTDDTGTPLALELPPDTPLCVQVTALNATTEPAVARVQVAAEAQATALPFVATSPFLALSTQISIPALAVADVETHACNTRPNTRFWTLTTRTFRQGIEARLQRGGSVLLSNLDWAAPQSTLFGPPDFIAFDGVNRLTTTCTYNNPTPRVITFGASPSTDETCEAIGYFFPASGPTVCINGILLP